MDELDPFDMLRSLGLVAGAPGELDSSEFVSFIGLVLLDDALYFDDVVCFFLCFAFDVLVDWLDAADWESDGVMAPVEELLL